MTKMRPQEIIEYLTQGDFFIPADYFNSSHITQNGVEGYLTFNTLVEREIRVFFDKYFVSVSEAGSGIKNVICDIDVGNADLAEAKKRFGEYLARMIFRKIKNLGLTVETISPVFETLGHIGYDFEAELLQLFAEAQNKRNEACVNLLRDINKNTYVDREGFFLDCVHKQEDGKMIGRAEHTNIPGLFLVIEYENFEAEGYVLKIEDKTSNEGNKTIVVHIGFHTPPKYIYDRISQIVQSFDVQNVLNPSR